MDGEILDWIKKTGNFTYKYIIFKGVRQKGRERKAQNKVKVT